MKGTLLGALWLAASVFFYLSGKSAFSVWAAIIVANLWMVAAYLRESA